MRQSDLYHYCYVAYDEANKTEYKVGTNYWMDVFSYHLKEQINANNVVFDKKLKEITASQLLDLMEEQL